MNIMRVSATERTQQTGIRKVVGATHRGILLQFLVEAVLLSVGGGAVGVGLGVAAAGTVSAAAGWPTLLAPQAVMVAFGFAPARAVPGTPGSLPRPLRAASAWVAGLHADGGHRADRTALRLPPIL